MAHDDERGDFAHGPHDIPLDSIRSDRGAIAEAIAEIRLLIAEAKGLLDVEKAYFKSRLDFTKGQIAKLAIIAVLAIVFALLVALALVVGALLIFTALVGPLLATLIVAGALIVVTALLALGCKGALRDIKLKR